MEINQLITNLTPLYNEYRKNRDTAAPVEQIILMWKIGDVLKKFLAVNDIAPHALYREIYGKSESSSNVSQRSYITREFLSRSYRVRGMFKNQKEIRDTFPNLTSLSHFREAMPFFDNPKHKLDDTEKSELIAVLNSHKPNGFKSEYVSDLQKKKIGKKNPRTQRLNELQTEKEVFIHFYNKVYETLKSSSHKDALKKLEAPSPEFIKALAQNTGALSADGLKMNEMVVPDTMGTWWQNYTNLVATLISKENPIERRRFRRLIPADRFVRLTEMLYALTDEQSFNNLKAK